MHTDQCRKINGLFAVLLQLQWDEKVAAAYLNAACRRIPDDGFDKNRLLRVCLVANEGWVRRFEQVRCG
jgi:hypothetical protein